MKFSTKSDYAARAVLGLAEYYPDGGARRVEELAKSQGISSNYLVQILIDLKSDGIVRSLRGKGGGYLLARSPSEISLGDIIRCCYGQVFDSPAFNDEQCPSSLKSAWNQLGKGFGELADEINFQDLLDEESEQGKMYYI